MPRPVRGVWVARFHYRYPDDVRTILRNCAALKLNTVYWQVRGAGTVAYPSQVEPWGREFDFADPGFDPLALAVEQAHANGLRIEAWVNVVPGWQGEQPPPSADHLWNTHPEWFLQDAAGRRQPLNRNYVLLNPALPEVRQHIVRIIEEILSRYDVDGVHLDYVRYAWDEEPGASRRYPRDPRTLALYRQETGLHPDDDPSAWDRWRANQLTRLVAEIRAAVDRRRPGATLSAAVMRNPTSAARDCFQNGVAWLRTGLVDALLPMAYTEKAGEFEASIAAYRELVGPCRLIPGVGIYKHASDGVMREQLIRCMQWGGDFCLFSYASLYATHQDRAAGSPDPQEAARRAMRRAVLSELLSAQ
jgi:uncharacterized lipoprotein YddW (UPF0748 family)